MKLTFALFNYFPYGGLQRDFFRIAQECEARDHDITVYTQSWRGDKPKAWNIIELPTTRSSNHQASWEFVQQLQPLLHDNKGDRLVGFNKMPGLDIYYAGDVCLKESALKKYGLLAHLLPRHRALIALERAVFQIQSKTKILCTFGAFLLFFEASLRVNSRNERRDAKHSQRRSTVTPLR